MFSSQYQGGKSVEVFAAQGKDPLNKLRIQGGHTVNKEFDQYIKGYVLALSGTPATTRVHLPKTDRRGLGLLQPFLLIQLYVPQDSRFLLEFSVFDTTNSKRRFQLLPWQQERTTTPLLSKLPLSVLPDQWQWVLLDLSMILQGVYSRDYQTLESITFCGTCKIRRVATLRDRITSPGDLPSSWQPPPSIPQLPLVVIDSSTTLNTCSGKKDTVQPKHIAFGEKILIPPHILQYTTSSTSPAVSRTTSSSTSGVVSRTTSSSTSGAVSRTTSSSTSPVVSRTTSSQEHSGNVKKCPQNDQPLKTQVTKPVSNKLKTHDIKSDETHSSIPAVGLVPKPTVLSGDEEQAITTLQSVTRSKVFTYNSPPHSATKRKSSESISHKTQTRGAELNEDFLSIVPERSTLNDENYDWHQYQSLNSSSSDDETPPTDQPLQKNRTRQSQLDESLETSFPTGTLQDQLKALQLPQHDTIDVTRMGGPLTPHNTIGSLHLEENDHDPDEKLELLYDPDLNYFYDPRTGKCYQLTQSL